MKINGHLITPFADLRGADLRGANLRGAKNIPNLPETVIVPDGDLIVYKNTVQGVIKLLIPKEAKRTNGTSRKCRAEFAIVLEMPPGITAAASLHQEDFVYELGKRMIPNSFDEDRWNECSPGIHFFLTKEEAENYK